MLRMNTMSSCMIPSCFWDNLRYFDSFRENYLDVSFYDTKSSIFFALFLFLARTNFQYVNPLFLKHCVAINSIYPFVSIQNINKCITTNYDTQPDSNEKKYVSITIHQIQILNKSEYQKQKRK